jgi:hypothetical protein
MLSRFSPDLEIYSIDEAFLGMSGFGPWLENHARAPRDRACLASGELVIKVVQCDLICFQV